VIPQTATPMVELARRWGDDWDSGEGAKSFKNRINRYLTKAERLNLLRRPYGRGRPGGEMTDKCRQILEGASS